MTTLMSGCPVIGRVFIAKALREAVAFEEVDDGAHERRIDTAAGLDAADRRHIRANHSPKGRSEHWTYFESAGASVWLRRFWPFSSRMPILTLSLSVFCE